MTAGLKEGTRLQGGKYRIERMLGAGSFGITYLATAKFTTQGNLGTMEVEARVAIKEFFMRDVNTRRNDGSTIEGSTGSVFTNYRKKFRKEAENLSKLSHPNIVKVFDVFDENNTTYYVMDFIEGENLDDYIGQRGKLTETEAIPILKEIGDAVSYMHSKKMLHLDIKPKNVMRKSDGHYYLIDFGLSKQFTENGEPESSTTIGLGTPGYAPGEQAAYRQDGTFPATLDVYALGATMLKMLTGKTPPEATYVLNYGFPESTLSKANVSEQTISAVRKAMAPIIHDRFQKVRYFIESLPKESDEPTEVWAEVDESERKEPGSPTPHVTPIPNPKPKVKFNKSWLYWGVGAVVVFAVGFMMAKWSGKKTEPDPDPKPVVEVKEVPQINGHEYVDLGLPSGLKWATCNVGASNPWDFGDYFDWGDTSPKSSYTEENCKTFGKDLGDISGNPNYDAARANWGGSWRMPTKAELEELVAKCKWQWRKHHGINGYMIVGPNGDSIFLPAAGRRDGIYTNFVGGDGYYLSSTPNGETCKWFVNFDESRNYVGWSIRGIGLSVRPVREK